MVKKTSAQSSHLSYRYTFLLTELRGAKFCGNRDNFQKAQDLIPGLKLNPNSPYSISFISKGQNPVLTQLILTHIRSLASRYLDKIISLNS